jgi:hypothetical protein
MSWNNPRTWNTVLNGPHASKIPINSVAKPHQPPSENGRESKALQSSTVCNNVQCCIFFFQISRKIERFRKHTAVHDEITIIMRWLMHFTCIRRNTVVVILGCVLKSPDRNRQRVLRKFITFPPSVGLRGVFHADSGYETNFHQSLLGMILRTESNNPQFNFDYSRETRAFSVLPIHGEFD